jgi:hypothetical protein
MIQFFRVICVSVTKKAIQDDSCCEKTNTQNSLLNFINLTTARLSPRTTFLKHEVERKQHMNNK